MRKVVIGLCTVLVLGVGSTAWAKMDVAPCKEISWTPNNVYTVHSQLHVATHIILPEPMQGKPVAGNATLWAVNGENVHLFIKPKTLGEKEGAQTSVSVIGEDNTSFDFFIERVARDPDICIKIVKDQTPDFHDAPASQGWRTPQQHQTQQLAAQITAAQQTMSQHQQQLAKVKASSQQQILQTLADYRTHIYTGYVWEDGGSDFFGDDVISDVYDDGRFTFIRVTHDNKGLLQISATIEGEEEMLEYDYDEDRRIYTIAGIFPAFVMRYDESEIEVKRRDGRTKGAS